MTLRPECPECHRIYPLAISTLQLSTAVDAVLACECRKQTLVKLAVAPLKCQDQHGTPFAVAMSAATLDLGALVLIRNEMLMRRLPRAQSTGWR